jgi:uncharacterized protein (UPF0262 family)
MEAGFNSAAGNACLSCYFLDFHAFKISENEDFAMLLGELLHRFGESGGAEILVHFLGMVGLKCFFQDQFLIVNQSFLFAVISAAQVQQDAMDPGINGRLSAKSSPRSDGLDQCFLN